MSSEILAPFIEIHNERFHRLKERRHGIEIYTNIDKTKYLRIGSFEEVQKELPLHKHLLALGFPFPHILEEGVTEGRNFWIEESLGRYPFGAIFEKEMETWGYITEETFSQFLEIVSRFKQAQAKTIEYRPMQPGALGKTVGFDACLAMFSSSRNKLEEMWQKILLDLQDVPLCFTHGDFLPNNILERGVIDFEDHFLGPIGYDLLNPITTPFWFPKDPIKGFQRKSSFSEAQIARYFRTIEIPNTLFDALFLLRSTWWTMGNGKSDALQEWRNDRFFALVDLYIEEKSLYKYWLESSTREFTI